MNVLGMLRQEFTIDDRRIYLMGHSQSGGGARHLAEMYADTASNGRRCRSIAQYVEKPGLDHGTIIMGAMPDVFQFFEKACDGGAALSRAHPRRAPAGRSYQVNCEPSGR